MSRIELCVFDAYGTLFDVAAAARRLAEDIASGGAHDTGAAGRAFSERWTEAAEHWRRKQLEYTWIRGLFGAHRDFRRVTEDALGWTLDALQLSASAERAALEQRLMGLYDVLDAYPEVKTALEALAVDGRRRAILSNGTAQMLASATRSAQIADLLEAALSADDAGVFKTNPKVYDLVEARLGVQPPNVLFVSSNGWDVCCAAAYGFRSVWVNRRGDPLDRLPGAPDRVVSSLEALPEIARELGA